MPTHRSSLLGLLLANYSSALFTDSILPPSFTVEEIGMANDTAFPNVYRDGGGGGLVNGKNIIVYSDTSTTSGGPSASLRYFTSNSIAYVFIFLFMHSLSSFITFITISPDGNVLTSKHSLILRTLQALPILAQMEHQILESLFSRTNQPLPLQTGTPNMSALLSGQAVSRSLMCFAQMSNSNEPQPRSLHLPIRLPQSASTLFSQSTVLVTPIFFTPRSLL